MANKPVVTRFAPSPTGFLHVGGIRTALFAYVFAKHSDGKFILRIEDTDKKREVDGSVQQIIDSLTWLGIMWDEGPVFQSERLGIYKEWAQKLIDKGLAYTDESTPEQLEELRQSAKDAKKAFLFREFRPKEPKVANDWYGKLPLRFLVSDIKPSLWHDEVKGDMHAGPEALDDFIIIKADGFPTYNFAHIVDDFLMEVTHIMRGDEFTSSVPKYLSLYEALEIAPPQMATMPPILGPTGGKKLSKRDGARDVLSYRDEGYLSEGVFNYIALLGWNDGSEQEIFSSEEIITKFDLHRIQKSGARFDEAKLAWVNWQHLVKLSEHAPEQFVGYIQNILKLQGDRTLLEKSASLAMTKANSFETLAEQLSIFTTLPTLKLDDAFLKTIDPGLTLDTANQYIGKTQSELVKLSDFSSQNIEACLRQLLTDFAAQPRIFLNLIRWVISGRQVSPNLFAMIATLGKDEVITRLDNSLKPSTE